MFHFFHTASSSCFSTVVKENPSVKQYSAFILQHITHTIDLNKARPPESLPTSESVQIFFLKQQVHLVWACKSSLHGCHTTGMIARVFSIDGNTSCEDCAPSRLMCWSHRVLQASEAWVLRSELLPTQLPLSQDSQCPPQGACAPPSFSLQLLDLFSL